MKCLVLSIICSLFLLGGAQRSSAEPPPVRIGYFANITHAQALVGKANGTFEKRMGVKIDWKGFNAGPTAMEALLSGALDIAYVGPNPAVNAYLRSGGKALRVISGACSGGAALVVHRESGVTRPADLKGKRVASPELGNTQDVALRHWLATQGLKPNRDVKVLPVKNSEIMLLFQQKQIAAAWVPEPWVSRLVAEAGGTIMVDERSLWPEGRFTTAVVVVRTEFLEKNRELVRRFLEAQVETTSFITKQPARARKALNAELAAIVHRPMPEKILDEAMSRLTITCDPYVSAMLTSAGWARELGFLPKKEAARDLKPMFDLTLLNQVLKERRLPTVK